MKNFEDDYRRGIGRSGIQGLGNPRVKKELEDRISRLQEALTTAEDDQSRQEVQFLLDRARGDYQKYVTAEKQMAQKIHYDRQFQRVYAQKKKKQTIILTASVVGTILLILFLVLHFNASHRAAKNEAAAKAAFQQKSNPAESKPDPDNRLGDDELLPKNLIGTWTGTQGGATITLTFEEDGTVTVNTELSDGSYTENSGAITSTLPVDDTTFRIVYSSGNVFPGQSTQGLGYELGYKLSNDGKTLYPIQWDVQNGQKPDYSQYKYDKDNALTKSE
ncbi:hypothetical protein ACFSN5_07145 [Streptococcus tangpeifui]|uniref:hypothetical protein n=1 Tax=Streptococcus tangpeifui TaxID=2709400 RepID=UPI0013EC8596|nr:hypothetical protein [Streptococcus sp. ZJ1593]